MIRLYVFLLDFLIPFLCDPDLQCFRAVAGGGVQLSVSLTRARFTLTKRTSKKADLILSFSISSLGTANSFLIMNS